MLLTVVWANNRILLGHPTPCSIPSFSPCLGRRFVRWGQTGESQLWEQMQGVVHRPPALATCAPHPALRPSRRKAQSAWAGRWGREYGGGKGPLNAQCPPAQALLISLIDSIQHEWRKCPRACSKLVVQTWVQIPSPHWLTAHPMTPNWKNMFILFSLWTFCSVMSFEHRHTSNS